MERDQASRYADLDKRLYEIGASDTALLVHQRKTEHGTEPIAGPKTEEQSYRSAFELIREKRFDDAVTALNSFIVDYPNGQFTPNAFYWLGEVYLVRFQIKWRHRMSKIPVRMIWRMRGNTLCK
ncbi:MAG: hypothetical protein CM1200mP24_07740 [Gammaproteobacteria bacterium]|nr:MAG: hypothetical protein CM1200mP24_07740 [Gammaproteobacteria bacterium]